MLRFIETNPLTYTQTSPLAGNSNFVDFSYILMSFPFQKPYLASSDHSEDLRIFGPCPTLGEDPQSESGLVCCFDAYAAFVVVRVSVSDG